MSNVQLVLYDRLGIPREASFCEIRSAYRKKALQCHPDKPGGDAASFLDVVEAFEILADPVQRARYDKECRMGQRHVQVKARARSSPTSCPQSTPARKSKPTKETPSKRKEFVC
jgi:curved DNA-binding protein CbpA